MKKNIYIMSAAVAFAALTSCSDFLEQDLRSDIPGADFYATETGFESLTNASYSSMRTIYSKEPWLFEGGSDLFTSAREQVSNCCLCATSYSTADDDVQTFYTRHYQAISLANEVIYRGGSIESRANRVAEARGLRAFYYLNLVQQFGGVPLVIERSSAPLTSVARASAEEVYDFIIKELTEVSESADLQTTNADGRFNTLAAKHFLAKAYLCRAWLTGKNADFESAVTAAKAAGAGNALTTEFATLFSNAGEGNAEVLFFVEYSAGTVDKQASDGNMQQACFATYLDGQEKGHKRTNSFLAPTLWMHEVFNTNTTDPKVDSRYEATFMTELRESYWHFYDADKKDVSKVTYYYCPSWLLPDTAAWRAALPSHASANIIEMVPEGKNYVGNVTTYEQKLHDDVYGVGSFRKFDDTENGRQYFATTSSMRDIYVARLGETNLIAAEACVKLNKNDDAVKYVNIVRDRAKATAATAAEMSIEYILNERARELAGENLRWTDLSRTGMLAKYVEEHNPDVKAGQVTSKFYLRPIPLAAMELNPALEQNELWK